MGTVIVVNACFSNANPKLKSLYFADTVIPGCKQGHRQEMLEGAAAPKVSLCPRQHSLLNYIQNWQAFIHACIAVSSCTLKDEIKTGRFARGKPCVLPTLS